jgi:hypothetical protein
MLGSSRVAAQLAASREGLGSMSEWVSDVVCNECGAKTERRILFSYVQNDNTVKCISDL